MSISRALAITVGLFSTPLLAADADLIEKGEYLARASDCVACHTKPGGKPFAGGLAMPTPVGEIYTTNITPDPKTGIGHYSLEQFDAALRKGESPDGPLYPAMPYPSYSKMTDDDVAALYAYFLNAVQPVHQENTAPDIPWPLNMRWPLNIWQSAFLEEGVFQKDPAQSEQWNRGAYLVQGAGHCGSCHTPRGIGFQEKALTEKGDAFLAGAELDGWWATSLRGDRQNGIGALSAQQIADLLKTGMAGQITVSGSMGEVVSHSTQNLTDEDLMAIGVYLKSLSPSPETFVTNVEQPTLNGAELYNEYCSTCHGQNGDGFEGVTPALASNPTVVSRNPSSAIRVVLNGTTTPVSGPGHTQRIMPGYGWQLNNDQIANLLTFMRTRWGNDAPPVSAEDVEQHR
ncbi:cytochrome c [Marinobacter sp. S0848L]|uniref:c-type cytochrome n=1 Tax=Marinobacter sp. S0848L TaxID=2926423 RepID=UPI001FF194E1|nr:cytochrome c [Marinobacter sp. S0848L]MCK0104896.1 cytochrome c [Marinobacter sp. S0848L]